MNNAAFPTNEGAVLDISHVKKVVMLVVTEEKLGAFFLNEKAAIPI